MERRIEELRALRTRVAVGQREARDDARRIGMALRGSGGTYGFPEVTAAAALLETSGDRDVLRRLEGLVVTLRGVESEGVADVGSAAEWLLHAAELDADPTVLEGAGSVEHAWERVCALAGLETGALAQAVARYFDLEWTAGPLEVGRSAARLVPEALVATAGVVPLEEDSRVIRVATSDPTSSTTELELERLTGRTPLFSVATPEQIRGATGTIPAAADASPELARRSERVDEVRVLIVDDDPSVRVLLGGMLAPAAYDVLEAEDGAQALRTLGRHPDVDLVVTGLRMAGMDGLELLWALREGSGSARPPVIVVTGAEDPALETLLLEEGAADYLRKPVDRRLFVSRVEASLRRHRV